MWCNPRPWWCGFASAGNATKFLPFPADATSPVALTATMRPPAMLMVAPRRHASRPGAENSRPTSTFETSFSAVFMCHRWFFRRNIRGPQRGPSREVGLPDLLAASGITRGAAPDDAPCREHDAGVGECSCDLEVLLYQQDGDP